MEQEFTEQYREPHKEQEPTEQDWIALQGGIPELWYKQNSPSCLIIHNYVGSTTNPKPNGAKIPTPLYQFRRPEVTLLLGGRKVNFPRAMLWGLHGQPCEASSLRQGAEGYDRIAVEDPSYQEKLIAQGYTKATLDELREQLS